MLYTKEQIREAARKNVIAVTFIKKDGSPRAMLCTLQEQYLPSLMGDTEITTKDNPEVLAVWDVESHGWRSFHIDSITDANLEPSK